MMLSFVLLSKVGLGGGGFVALIVAIIIIICVYREDHPRYSNEPNGFQLLFGGLAFKLSQSYDSMTAKSKNSKEFDLPPSFTLKLLVGLSGVGLWFYGIFFMAEYDVSFIWIWLWGIFLPFFYVYLFYIWKHFYFVWLGRIRTSVAVTISIVSIIILIVIWIVLIKVFKYCTSMDYLMEYYYQKGFHQGYYGK